MIPSLNLNKVSRPTGAPPRVVGDGAPASPTPPMSAHSDNGGGVGTLPTCGNNHVVASGERVAETPSDYDAIDSNCEYSAAPTPHVDANELLGCDVSSITDVKTLQAKLIDCQRLFLLLEQRYDRALDAKERQLMNLQKMCAQQLKLSVGQTPRIVSARAANSGPAGGPTIFSPGGPPPHRTPPCHGGYHHAAYADTTASRMRLAMYGSLNATAAATRSSLGTTSGPASGARTARVSGHVTPRNMVATSAAHTARLSTTSGQPFHSQHPSFSGSSVLPAAPSPADAAYRRPYNAASVRVQGRPSTKAATPRY